ncbi:hypothetical protein J7J08_13040 [Stenotrophomonas sp. ISL-67]|uniref:hypothetical protein n=1 Tax=Stenotrophomonas sp. ISL-67 TaxID=2819171 RepID=UPI001BE72B93|nr:hypothetical protein [Stenotrophomonas sp. ISL-67]MBT2768564.1 hypothetical protein [Stenotrophomonas sp. ISL-67]
MVDIEIIEHSKSIREMSFRDAADWLMENYPAGAPHYGTAFQLMPRRSWKRSDQIRLAEHYLARLPFASSTPYRVFLSFMAAEVFVSQIRKFLPDDESSIDLLRFHLGPVMREAATSDVDRALFSRVMAELDRAAG